MNGQPMPSPVDTGPLPVLPDVRAELTRVDHLRLGDEIIDGLDGHADPVLVVGVWVAPELMVHLGVDGGRSHVVPAEHTVTVVRPRHKPGDPFEPTRSMRALLTAEPGIRSQLEAVTR